MSGQTVYVVYADILFFINFCIDFICLYLSAKLCACPAGIARTALASALGGLYAIAALALDVLPVPAKLPLHLLAAFVICFAAFFRGDWKKLLISCGLFVVSNALMGGLLTAVYTLSGKYAHYNGGFYAEIGARKPYRRRAGERALRVGVRLFVQAKAQIAVRRRGNRLRWKALRSAPAGRQRQSAARAGQRPARSSCSSGALPTGDMTVLETPGQRVIPFSSAAGSDILIGFRPERITLKTLTKPKDIQAYLAFDKAGNSFAGTDGLFPASLL